MSNKEDATSGKGRSKDVCQRQKSTPDTNIWDQVFEPEVLATSGLNSDKEPSQKLNSGRGDKYEGSSIDSAYGDTVEKDKDSGKENFADPESDHSWLVSQLYGDEDGEGEVGDSVRALTAGEEATEPGELVNNNDNNGVNHDVCPGTLSQLHQQSSGCLGGQPVTTGGQHHGHSKDGQPLVEQMNSGPHTDQSSWWNAGQWSAHINWVNGWSGVVPSTPYATTAGPDGMHPYTNAWPPEYNRPHANQYWRHGRDDSSGAWDRRYDSRRDRRYTRGKSRSPDRARWDHRRRETSERDRKKDERSSREKDRERKDNDRRTTRGHDHGRSSSSSLVSRSRSYTSDSRRDKDHSRTDYYKDTRRDRDSYRQEERKDRDRSRHGERYTSSRDTEERESRGRDRNHSGSQDRKESRPRTDAYGQRDRSRTRKYKEPNRYDREPQERESVGRSDNESTGKPESELTSRKEERKDSPHRSQKAQKDESKGTAEDKDIKTQKPSVENEPSRDTDSMEQSGSKRIPAKGSRERKNTQEEGSKSSSESGSESDSGSSSSSSGSDSSSNSSSSSSSDSDSSSSSESDDEGEKGKTEETLEDGDETLLNKEGFGPTLPIDTPEGELSSKADAEPVNVAKDEKKNEDNGQEEGGPDRGSPTEKKGAVSILERAIAQKQDTLKRLKEFAGGPAVPRQVSIKEKIKIKLNPRPMKQKLLIKPVELVPADDLTSEHIDPEPQIKENVEEAKKDVETLQPIDCPAVAPLEDGNPTKVISKENTESSAGVINQEEENESRAEPECSNLKKSAMQKEPVSLTSRKEPPINAENKVTLKDIPLPGFETISSKEPAPAENKLPGDTDGFIMAEKKLRSDCTGDMTAVNKVHEAESIDVKVKSPKNPGVRQTLDHSKKSPSLGLDTEIRSGEMIPPGDMRKLIDFNENGATVRINGAVEKISGDDVVFQIRDKISGTIVKVTDVTVKSLGERSPESTSEDMKVLEKKHPSTEEYNPEEVMSTEEYKPEEVIVKGKECSVIDACAERLCNSETKVPIEGFPMGNDANNQQSDAPGVNINDSRGVTASAQVLPREPMDLPMPAFAKFYGYNPTMQNHNSPSNPPANECVVREGRGLHNEEPGKPVKGHIRSPNEGWQGMRALRTLDMSNTPNGSAPIISLSNNESTTNSSNKDPRLVQREQQRKSSKFGLSVLGDRSTNLEVETAVPTGVDNIFELIRNTLNSQSNSAFPETVPEFSENKCPTSNASGAKSSIDEARRVPPEKRSKAEPAPERKTSVMTPPHASTKAETLTSPDSFKARKHTKWSQWKASHSIGELYKGNSNGLTVLPQGKAVDQSLLPEAKLLKSLETKRRLSRVNNIKIDHPNPKNTPDVIEDKRNHSTNAIMKLTITKTDVIDGKLLTEKSTSSNVYEEMVNSGSKSIPSPLTPENNVLPLKSNSSDVARSDIVVMLQEEKPLGQSSAAVLHQLIEKYCETPAKATEDDSVECREQSAENQARHDGVQQSTASYDNLKSLPNGEGDSDYNILNVSDENFPDKSVDDCSVNERINEAATSKENILEDASSHGQTVSSLPGDPVVELSNDGRSDDSNCSQLLNETQPSSIVEGKDSYGQEDVSYGLSSSNPEGKESFGQESHSYVSCDLEGTDPDRNHGGNIEDEVENTDPDELRYSFDNEGQAGSGRDHFQMFEPLNTSKECNAEDSHGVDPVEPFDFFSRTDWEVLLNIKAKSVLPDKKTKTSQKKKEAKQERSVSGSSSCDSNSRYSSSSSGTSSSSSDSSSCNVSNSHSNKGFICSSVANAISSRSPVSQMNLSTPKQCLPNSPVKGTESLISKKEIGGGSGESQRSLSISSDHSDRQSNGPSDKSNSHHNSPSQSSIEDSNSSQGNDVSELVENMSNGENSTGSSCGSDEMSQFRRIFGTDDEDSEEEESLTNKPECYTIHYERKPIYHPTVTHIESDVDKESKSSSIEDKISVSSQENNHVEDSICSNVEGVDVENTAPHHPVRDQSEDAELVGVMLNIPENHSALPTLFSDDKCGERFLCESEDRQSAEGNSDHDLSSCKSGADDCTEETTTCDRLDHRKTENDCEDSCAVSECYYNAHKIPGDEGIGDVYMNELTGTLNNRTCDPASGIVHRSAGPSVSAECDQNSVPADLSKQDKSMADGAECRGTSSHWIQAVGDENVEERAISGPDSSDTSPRGSTEKDGPEKELNNNSHVAACKNDENRDFSCGSFAGPNVELINAGPNVELINENIVEERLGGSKNSHISVNSKRVNLLDDSQEIVDSDRLVKNLTCDKLDNSSAIFESKRHKIKNLTCNNSLIGDCDKKDTPDNYKAIQVKEPSVNKFNLHNTPNVSKGPTTKKDLPIFVHSNELVPPGTTPPRPQINQVPVINHFNQRIGLKKLPLRLCGQKRKSTQPHSPGEAPPGTEPVALPVVEGNTNVWKIHLKKSTAVTCVPERSVSAAVINHVQVRTTPSPVASSRSREKEPPEVRTLPTVPSIQWRPRYQTDSDSGHELFDKRRSSHSKSSSKRKHTSKRSDSHSHRRKEYRKEKHRRSDRFKERRKDGRLKSHYRRSVRRKRYRRRSRSKGYEPMSSSSTSSSSEGSYDRYRRRGDRWCGSVSENRCRKRSRPEDEETDHPKSKKSCHNHSCCLKRRKLRDRDIHDFFYRR